MHPVCVCARLVHGVADTRAHRSLPCPSATALLPAAHLWWPLWVVCITWSGRGHGCAQGVRHGTGCPAAQGPQGGPDVVGGTLSARTHARVQPPTLPPWRPRTLFSYLPVCVSVCGPDACYILAHLCAHPFFPVLLRLWCICAVVCFAPYCSGGNAPAAARAPFVQCRPRGTLQFMAPEMLVRQSNNLVNVTQKADVFRCVGPEA